MSDANLIKGEAGIGDDGNLEATEKQKRKARDEMDWEKGNYYKDEAEVNGITIVIAPEFSPVHHRYLIDFPQIKLGEETEEKYDIHDSYVKLGTEDQDTAKKVFDYAKEQAQKVSNVYELFRKVEDYTQDLPEDEKEKIE